MDKKSEKAILQFPVMFISHGEEVHRRRESSGRKEALKGSRSRHWRQEDCRDLQDLHLQGSMNQELIRIFVLSNLIFGG